MVWYDGRENHNYAAAEIEWLLSSPRYMQQFSVINRFTLYKENFAMAMNFNSNSVFNLTPISLSDMRPEISKLFLPGEEALLAFKTIRDQLVFTNKRIISVDVQGVTGKRKSYTSMPYSKIQFHSIQTPGLLELVPDSELDLAFANGTEAHFEFKGNVDIVMLDQLIFSKELEG